MSGKPSDPPPFEDIFGDAALGDYARAWRSDPPAAISPNSKLAASEELLRAARRRIRRQWLAAVIENALGIAVAVYLMSLALNADSGFAKVVLSVLSALCIGMQWHAYSLSRAIREATSENCADAAARLLRVAESRLRLVRHAVWAGPFGVVVGFLAAIVSAPNNDISDRGIVPAVAAMIAMGGAAWLWSRRLEREVARRRAIIADLCENDV